MNICAQVVGKQRQRRCCCLRAQAASISNWGNVFVPRSAREGRWRGTLKSHHLGLQHPRQNLLPEGQSRAPGYFSQSCQHWHSSCWPAAPGSLMAAAAAAQALRGPHCSFLRAQQAQSTLATGHGKGAWKLPVRQWECTTGREMLEEVSRKRTSELCCPFSTPSLWRTCLNMSWCWMQFSAPHTHLGTWTPRVHTLPQGPLWTPIWELLV